MIYASLTVAFVAIVAWDCWRRHLARLSTLQLSAATVRKELEDACVLWGSKLDALRHQISAVEKAIEKIEPGQKFNPLGKHYSPRS